MMTTFRKLWLQLIRQHQLKKEEYKHSQEWFDDEISEAIKNCDKFLKNLKDLGYILIRNFIM